MKVDAHCGRLAAHDYRQRLAVLHPVYLHRTEAHDLGQHFQVACDDGRGDIHHLFRLGVNLYESLAAPSVRHFHIGDNRLAVEQLFLLCFVIPLQWRGFQCRIEHHIHLTVVHADKGKAAAALDLPAMLVSDTHGKHGRMPAVADVFQHTHRQVLDHFPCKTESFQCRKG